MPTIIVSQLIVMNIRFQMSVSLGAGSLSLVSVLVVAAVVVPVCSAALLRARVPRSRHCAHCHRRVLIAGSSVPPHHSNCSNTVEREGMAKR